MGHCVTLIAILSFLTLACFPHSLHAAVPNVPVDNLVVFGDSYSDLGNFHRWTNGPVWSENVAVAWNASLYSFAYTGSACDNELYPDVPATDRMPSIRDQIELYYNLDLGLDANKTVFAIWVGITDIQKAYQQSLGTEDTQPDFGNIAKCIGQQVRNIRKAFKADRIMVFNVPPLEYMPFFVDDDNALDRAKWGAAAEQLNRMLRKDIAILNRNHHALKLDLVDIHSLLSDIVANPSTFSFTDASHAYLDACQNGCDNKIDDYLWWDRTHMTGGAHRAIANSILLSGSYAHPTNLDAWTLPQVQALIERPGSPYRSPIYVSPPNSGLIDRIVQEKTTSQDSFMSSIDNNNTGHSMWNCLTIGGIMMVLLGTTFKLLKKLRHQNKHRFHGGLLDPNSVDAPYYYRSSMTEPK
ncbi:hypothetical protein K492DRAFT_156545 [Lichtheimia hyalospora FSU 10163]|nr:hypothetical protein K492DRAFT_156545 [Lichtheimia hyalospora FSU 10163]